LAVTDVARVVALTGSLASSSYIDQVFARHCVAHTSRIHQNRL
jgi:hypothetical protein